MYRVFSQEPRGLPDVAKLAAQAARFFGAELELVERGADWIRVRVASSRPAFTAELVVRARDTTDGDRADARAAELRGRAAGMASLAERCRTIWELEPRDASAAPHDASAVAPHDVIACLTLAAICASTALGPVLPPDGSTLFGVRGAIERRDAVGARLA